MADACLAELENGAQVHSLSGSSAPTGVKPTFEPIAVRSRLAEAHPMLRTTEQRLIDLNARTDRAVDLWYAETDAGIEALGHGGRILRELRVSAMAIPARSARELALKARILSWHCSDLWEASDGDQNGILLRTFMEDALALGGLDRIMPREEDFSELLPGYNSQHRDPKADHLAEPASPITAECAVQAAPVSSAAFGVELHRLEDAFNSTDCSDHGLEAGYSIGARIDAIEAYLPFLPCATLDDALATCALAFDNIMVLSRQVTDRDNGPGEHIPRLKSALFAISNLLCSLTGKTREEAGLERYQPTSLDPFKLIEAASAAQASGKAAA